MRWFSSAFLVVQMALSPLGAMAQGPAYRAEIGQAYRSQLSNASASELWVFRSNRDECVTISISSREFAPVLHLAQNAPDGQLLRSNDNPSGGSSAVIQLQVPATDAYYIRAASTTAGGNYGEYMLTLRSC
jgi:hypothetical protein